MGLWTKKQREKGKEWTIENTDIILSLYDEGHSIHHIRQLCPIKIGRDLIETILISNGRTLRGISQNGKEKQLEKTRKTSLAKFGYENASSSPHIKEKRAQTFMTRMGVENPFSHKDIQEKIRATHIQKYGYPHPGSHMKRNITTKLSLPHLLLSENLIAAGIQHKNEVVIYNESILGKNKCPRVDILINNKLIIEVFGDYFHANPSKYKPSDLISRFKGKMEAKDIWEQDATRLNKLEKIGYNVLVIWEKDIKHDMQQVLKVINEAIKNIKD